MKLPPFSYKPGNNGFDTLIKIHRAKRRAMVRCIGNTDLISRDPVIIAYMAQELQAETVMLEALYDAKKAGEA